MGWRGQGDAEAAFEAGARGGIWRYGGWIAVAGMILLRSLALA